VRDLKALFVAVQVPLFGLSLTRSAENGGEPPKIRFSDGEGAGASRSVTDDLRDLLTHFHFVGFGRIDGGGDLSVRH
jgi:hypothetical protein